MVKEFKVQFTRGHTFLGEYFVETEYQVDAEDIATQLLSENNDADYIEKCPACGRNAYCTYKGAHDGQQPISPSQSACSSCGFFWSQDDKLEEEEKAKEYKKS